MFYLNKTRLKRIDGDCFGIIKMAAVISGGKVICTHGGSDVSPRTESNFRRLLELDNQTVGRRF